MNKLKRACLVALQLLVVLATLAATVIMFRHPACIEQMLAEVARGMSAGLLITVMKVLVVVSRPKVVCKSFSCWCRFGWPVARREVKCGLVGGYLLGLLMAMWACWNG